MVGIAANVRLRCFDFHSTAVAAASHFLLCASAVLSLFFFSLLPWRPRLAVRSGRRLIEIERRLERGDRADGDGGEGKRLQKKPKG